MTLHLSPAQHQVVNHRGSDLQVIACAGSGKTESMASRVAALVAEGVAPAGIVAFTFTDKAALELRERITRRVAERMGAGFRERLGPMFVGTIHAYCLRLLQDHVPHFGSYDVLDENQHAGLLSREHRHLGLAGLGARHWQPIRDFAKTLDVIGNELIRPSLLDGTVLGDCVRAHRDMLARYRCLTYATLVSSAVEAMEDPHIRSRVTAELRHLLVDEYQDINPAQEQLIELLAQPPVELVVVGDDDQAIYQWRGSDVHNILDFTARRPAAATVSLDQNRRSRPTILAEANAFAQTIPLRLPKTMKATRAPGKAEVVAWSAETEKEEVEQIAHTILRLQAQGHRLRDVAVLYRSVRTSAGPLLDAFDRLGIPYSCSGRTGLFLQPDIALLGELFAWFVDGDWKDERFGEARKASLDRLMLGLTGRWPGSIEGKELRQYLLDWKSFRRRGTRAVSLVEDLYKLLERLGVRTLDPDVPGDAARLGALARFSEVLADFEHVHRRGRQADPGSRYPFESGQDRGRAFFEALYGYLLHWARDAYEDFAAEVVANLDAVIISTVHQAKGLEWPVVFLPALVKGRFPSGRSGRSQTWLLPPTVFPPATQARYEGGDAEERRLFYVAMTRARDALYLSCFCRKIREFEPSAYLREVAGTDPPHLDPLPLPDPPEAAATGEGAPLDLPFSDLAWFEECGHAYRIGRLLGFRQELVVELGYGKAVHHVLRQMAELVRAEGVVPELERIEALLEQEFYVPYASVPGHAQMRRAASEIVRGYLEQYGAELQHVWAVERSFALHFDEGVVSGRADVILRSGDDAQPRLTLVDYKLAHDPRREESYHLQLAVYAAAARGEGLQMDEAYLHDLKDGSRHPVEIGATVTTEVAGRAREALRKMRTGSYLARPTPERCGSCAYRRLCTPVSPAGEGEPGQPKP